MAQLNATIESDTSDVPPPPPVLHNVQPEAVEVHPLVLLSVVDHYNRVAKDTKKRVVGLLLGSWRNKTVDVASSFAIPFEEAEGIFFLDHNFLENFWELVRKVNAKEKIVGWYHSGPKLRPLDLEINDIIRRFTPNPVLVIVDVEPKELGLPTESYFAIDDVESDTPSKRTFIHIPTSIQASEAEEIGVEHLLRDIKDNAVGTLSTKITSQLNALKGLDVSLSEVESYLEKVVNGTLPINHQITYNLQDMFNLLPDMNLEEIIHALSVQTNDQMLVIYLSSIVRSVIALHNLINNKIANRDAELEEQKAAKEKEKEGQANANSSSTNSTSGTTEKGKGGSDAALNNSSDKTPN